MGFPLEVRTKVLIRCARICCLCFKLCGNKIEVHHIKQEADGGANTENNALPLCLDCHAEVGSYNPRHPKGTKHSIKELQARRDALYKLVDSGTLAAQILVRQLPANAASKTTESVTSAIRALPAQFQPSEQSRKFLDRILKTQTVLSALPGKLKILDEEDAAWVLDSLVGASEDSTRAIKALAQLVPGLTSDQQQVAVERTVRNVMLFGETEQKAELLSDFGAKLLRLPDQAVQAAFFEDVFEIIRRDQFAEVNVLVPALVGAHAGLPEELWADYVMLLIDQSNSSSYHGAPAAKNALIRLPANVAKAGLLSLTPEVVAQFGHSRWESAKRLAAHYCDSVGGKQGKVIGDLAAMSWRAFREKHIPE